MIWIKISQDANDEDGDLVMRMMRVMWMVTIDNKHSAEDEDKDDAEDNAQPPADQPPASDGCLLGLLWPVLSTSTPSYGGERTQPRPASSRPMTAQSESRGTGLDKCLFGSKKARRQHVRDVSQKKRSQKRICERTAKRRRQAAAVVLEASDSASSRLARLQRSETAEEAGEPSAARPPRQRRVEEAVILEEKDEKKDEKLELLKEEVDVDLKPGVAELNYDEIVGSGDEDVEIQAVRRERARELALSKRKIEEDVLKAELEEEQEEMDEEESEYESESEENDDRRGPLMKPVFVSKANRETVREKEQIEKEEEEARRKKEVRQLERKAESKVLLIDRINEEAEAERLAEELDDRSDIELMDDDDEKNEAEEYELWKIRELKRIKRDKEEKLKRQEEIAFVLRRREMTDEERARDDAKLDAANPKRADVKQFNFLQKYYHRGGFFQDKAVSGEEALYLRDYHEPLEEEKYDKQLLPKAMQLRRGEFGKKGQVKHSHLTDVDTTDMSAAWAQSSKIVQRYQEKMAAAKGVQAVLH
eukprot:s1339_g1.t1